MVNVLVKEEMVLNWVEAESTLLDFIGDCESSGCEMFVEENGDEDTFETISDLFEFWVWLGVDVADLEKGRLDFISISYMSGDNEVKVKLTIDNEIKEFIIGVF